MEVPPVDFRVISANASNCEWSASIRERVVEARRIQTERFRISSNSTNSAMSPRLMKAHCCLCLRWDSVVESGGDLCDMRSLETGLSQFLGAWLA